MRYSYELTDLMLSGCVSVVYLDVNQDGTKQLHTVTCNLAHTCSLMNPGHKAKPGRSDLFYWLKSPQKHWVWIDIFKPV